MSPRAITFSPESVLLASLDVVRRQGWDSLTARSVAASLGASVVPVYSAFESMEKLLRETLIKIRSLLMDYTSRSYSNLPYLNMGVGIVSFARDEPNFFQALYQKRHGFHDVVDEVTACTLTWMKGDAELGVLNDQARVRLHDSIRFYTMGLAMAVAAGRIDDVSKNNFVRLLKNMGNALIFAEIAGAAEAGSPGCKKEWDKLLKTKPDFLPKPVNAKKHDGLKKKNK